MCTGFASAERSIERPMKKPIRLLVLAALFVLAFGAAYVRLPYYAEGPGPAREVQPLIDVGDEPRYDSVGQADHDHRELRIR